jgi:hypothetical protein
MYARSYDDRYRAARRFREIPVAIRKLMTNTDYALAERRCPRKMPIASLMRQALTELG